MVNPPGVHAKYSIIGAESGKHVWCEKPMAMDMDECQAIIENRKPIVPGEDGLMDIHIVNAIMESSREDGEWIDL